MYRHVPNVHCSPPGQSRNDLHQELASSTNLMACLLGTFLRTFFDRCESEIDVAPS